MRRCWHEIFASTRERKSEDEKRIVIANASALKKQRTASKKGKDIDPRRGTKLGSEGWDMIV